MEAKDQLTEIYRFRDAIYAENKHRMDVSLDGLVEKSFSTWEMRYFAMDNIARELLRRMSPTDQKQLVLEIVDESIELMRKVV